jgi:hypothetical protein
LTGIGLTGTAKAFLTGGPDVFGFPSEKDSLFGADIVGSGLLVCLLIEGKDVLSHADQELECTYRLFVFLDHSSIETGLDTSDRGQYDAVPCRYASSYIPWTFKPAFQLRLSCNNSFNEVR